MRLRPVFFHALALGLLSASGLPGANAQDPAAAPGINQQLLPPEQGARRTVKLFDLFCMTHVPNLDTIAAFAAANFEEITGAGLNPYRPTVPPKQLRAWRFSEFGHEFVLTTTLSAPDELFKTRLPEFASATSHACTLFLPGAVPAADIRTELTRLMARPPDDTFKPGGMSAVGWTGRTEKDVVPQMMVDVLHLAPQDGGVGGRLQTVAFVLPPQSSTKGDAQ